MTADARTRYDLALETAAAAAALALDFYHRDFSVDLKQDRSPVTEADRGAEALIRSAIERNFPADAILGEEAGSKPGTTGFRWIIDPIDGTRSFIRRIPLWATLIGIEHRGEQIAGVACIPALGQTFHALSGHGAYLDSSRIRVSDVNELSCSMLCYSSIKGFRKTNREAALIELTERTERQRGYGDFYGFVLVAQGACEIMIESGVHAWDVSALMAIVQEAGGMLTDWSGNATIDSPNVVATNGRLHDTVLAMLASDG